MKKRGGFTGIEILIAFGLLTLMTGWMGVAFKDEIVEFFKKPQPSVEETRPEVKNPFPQKPSEEPIVEPKETSVYREEAGTPIVPKVTATGEWHGRYTVTSPAECAGGSGGWEAMLTETSGRITGQYTTDDGVGGNVTGSRIGENASWSVGGASGVSFSGGISGNTISGNFSKGLPCYLNENNEQTKGTFFGGRIVQ